MRSSFVPFCLVLAACGVPTSTGHVVDADDSFEAVADAELSTDVKATLNGLTLSFKPVLVSRLVENQKRWVVQGSANKDLSAVFSFVPDDAYGTATLTGPRTFEVSLDAGSELNTVLSGLRLLVNVTPVGSTQAITAGLDFAPRFANITGSTKLSVLAPLSPVYARGGLTYRGTLRAAPGAQVSASTPDDATLFVTKRSTAGTWNVDLPFDDLALALDVPGISADKVEFLATERALNGAQGRTRSKLAVLTAVVRGVQLTTQDPYQVWPPVRCSTAARTCLNATPVGATDFGDCGSYREVSACGLPNQVPSLYPSPDDLTALTRALAAVRAPVGKSVSFTAFGVNGTRNTTVELVARGFLDQTGTQATLTGALTAGQVNTLLDGWNARSLVPATQQVVFQNSFKAVRLEGNGQTHVVLFFATAARATIITLR